MPEKKKYVKRPVVIEAYQTKKSIKIKTLEGVMTANKGDWVITGIKGEQYPCRANIFEKTYALHKPKKQQYIFVAREDTSDATLKISFVEMKKRFYRQELANEGLISFFIGGTSKIAGKEIDIDIEVKKGEQKRIPLPVELAEVVR